MVRREKPVSMLRTMMAASAIAPPCASRTAPMIWSVSVCAKADPARIGVKHHTASRNSALFIRGLSASTAPIVSPVQLGSTKLIRRRAECLARFLGAAASGHRHAAVDDRSADGAERTAIPERMQRHSNDRADREALHGDASPRDVRRGAGLDTPDHFLPV